MTRRSAAPADGSDALFGLEALHTPDRQAASTPATDHAPGDTFRDSDTARRLLPVRHIYAEPAAAASPRGRQILERFPDAQVTEVPSHWGIPGLHGNEGNVERWVRIKAETLVLGVRKSLTARPNGRSADFIAPGPSNGCALSCAYCYVPRRKGYANPITVFTNIDRIIGYLGRHIARQGTKPEPNQCDDTAWVYDFRENGDCSVDALICDNTADLVRAFRQWPTAKASFATKFVNPDLLGYDPGGRTRIRFSLMPPRTHVCWTCAPRRSPSASRPPPTSWTRGTRSTSTSPPSYCGPAGARRGPSCSSTWTTCCRSGSNARPPPR